MFAAQQCRIYCCRWNGSSGTGVWAGFGFREKLKKRYAVFLLEPKKGVPGSLGSRKQVRGGIK